MEPAEVLSYLKRIPMFQSLDDDGEDDLYRLVPYVQEHIYSPGDPLYAIDEIPNRTTLILEGYVLVNTVDDDGRMLSLPACGPGDILGRTSLRPGGFRSVQALAQTDVRVLDIQFRDLIRAYQNSIPLREQIPGTLAPATLVDTMKHFPILEDIDDETGEAELFKLMPLIHEQLYDDREWLFRQGEITDRLMYIIEGQVRLDLVGPDGTSSRVGVLIPGDTVGQTGLLVGDYHDVTATAEGFARALYILRKEFTPYIKERPGLRKRLKIPEEIRSRQHMREFDWLREDEWVVKLIQRHWIMLVRTIAAPVLLTGILLALAVAFLAAGGTVAIVSGVISMIVILFLSGIVAYQTFNWYDDYFVITTQRVVHTERVWPLSTKTEETSLNSIEDIYNIRSGITANILNYGNLVLQTAGETVQIDMQYIPNPDHAREIISEQIERYKARDLLQAQGQIRDMLTHRLKEKEPSPDANDTEKPAPKRGSTNVIVALVLALSEYLFPRSWTQAENSDTIIWRRYWLPGLWKNLPITLALLLVSIGGGAALIGNWENGNMLAWFFIWLLAVGVLAIFVLWKIEDWRNDYFQMTWDRIIQVDRQPLFLQDKRREARLERIQNLSFEVPGILARIFKFGHVQFETAGTEGKFEIDFVRDPAKVRAAISNQQHKYNQRVRQTAAKQRQQELLNWFTIYDEIQRDSNVQT